MAKIDIKKILACPKCKRNITQISDRLAKCTSCNLKFTKTKGIWNFLLPRKGVTQISKKQYDVVHTKKFEGPQDGSYEILASIARGNKTIDIACGEGQIEKLAPETIGVEFSLNALKKAKANGAKYLVLADAHALPFRDNSFDIAISAGSIEHFENPQKAINEMTRVAKIQVFTVHRLPPIPLASFLFNLFTKLMFIKHQPIEKPIGQKELKKMIEKAGLHIVFNGLWTLPVNYGRVIRILPEFKNIPSCHFVISIKK